MKKLFIPLVFVATAVSTGASACEWHAGGFGGYGSQWREYDPAELDALIEATYKRTTAATEGAENAKPKPRPAFSSTAARAVEAGKVRAASNADDDASATTEAESN